MMIRGHSLEMHGGDQAGQQSGYDLQSQESGHTRNPSSDISNGGYSTSVGQPQAMQGAQELRRLAYASGLGSAGRQNTTASSALEEHPNALTHRSPLNTVSNSGPPGSPVQSRANFTPQHVYPSNPSPVDHDSAQTKFVDPTQVFNPYHREVELRKQQTAAAEVEARINAAVSSPGSGDGSKTWSQVVGPPEVKSLSTTTSEMARGDIAKESQTELPASTRSSIQDTDIGAEMRAMVERMREIRNKNPILFHKLWNDMKKGGSDSSGVSGTTPTASPQLGQDDLPNESPAQPLQASLNEKQRPDAPQNDTKTGIPPNDYNLAVKNSEGGLPAIGRFPAERRHNVPYTKNTANDVAEATIPKISTASVSANKLATNLAPQPLPSQTASEGTVWPEEKQKALAEAAVKALIADPENRGKGLTELTVQNMLEGNPSYIELCTLLEKRGYRFHRGKFARQLLSSVPDLAPPPQVQQVPYLKPIRTAMPPRAADFSAAAPNRAGAGPQPTLTHPPNVRGAYSTNFKPESRLSNAPTVRPTPHPPPKSQGSHLAQATKQRLGVPVPNIPTPSPGSKEAMARKRDFSELVDLTALEDDEDYVMPSKKPRTVDASPEPGVFKVEASSGQAGRNAVDHSRHEPGSEQPFLPSPTDNRALRPFPNQTASTATPIASSQLPRRDRAILAKPINKSEALRKSYYDPKTVARDILIAAGRHPSERDLNAHMAGLLHRHIELDSDLSTFEWDAVDPGGPPMPRVEMVDIPAGPPKWKVGVPRKGPRQVHEDEPRPGQEIGANFSAAPTTQAMLESMTRLSQQTKSLIKESQKTIPTPSHLRLSQLADNPISDVKSPSPRASPFRHPNTVEVEGKIEAMDQSEKRGRPPGSKNKRPSLLTMKHTANASTVVSVATEPHYEIYRCHWRKCSALLHNLPTLRRHIAKVHRPSTEDVQAHGYTCWWKNCRTLHRNLDKTITPTTTFDSQSEWLAHIDEDHLEPIGKEKGDGPSTSHIGKRTTFDVSKYFYHPSPACTAQTRTVSYTDPHSVNVDRKKYLSDKHGRAVTAPATAAANSSYAPDTIALAAVSNNDMDRIAVAHYMKSHGNDKLDLKKSAEEILRSMQAHKQKVGPGLDRGGCTLVNDTRRKTLLQGQWLARVVDVDGDDI